MSKKRRSDEGAELPRPVLRGPVDLRSIALTGLLVVATVFAMRGARELFLPILLAMLLKFLLNPITRLLERLRIPVGIAAFVVVLGMALGIGLLVRQVYEPAQAWLGELPETLARAESKLDELREPVEKVSEVARRVEELAGNGEAEGESPAVEIKEEPLSEAVFSGLRAFAGTALIAGALLYFLLTSGDLFSRKLAEALPRLREKRRAVEIARQIERDVSRYLVTISAVNVALGVAVALGMHFLGMPTPVLWGAMAAVLNFMPYVGAAVGASVLSVASFLNFEQVPEMVAPPLLYLVLTGVEGLLLTPTIIGRRLALNPVAVFLGLMFWSWMWGVPGTLLAVPLLMAVKIFCDRVPPLAAVGSFMGR